MPLTIQNVTGDGATVDYFDVSLTLPDSGGVTQITGRVQPLGGASASVTGGPLTLPAAPASGSLFVNVQVDSVSGAATVQQSTSGDPAPISGTARVVFRQTLAPSSTDLALTPESTPDNW